MQKKRKPAGKVKVKKSKKPKTDAVPADARWVEVSIQLTPEQKTDLEKMGVKTSALKIRTFDVARLQGPGPLEN